MGALIGFQTLRNKPLKAKKGSSGSAGGATDAQQVQFIVTTLPLNPTVNQITATQDALRKLPPKVQPEAQIEIAKLDNKKSELQSKQNASEYNQAVFDANIQDAKDSVLSPDGTTIQNMAVLASNYKDILQAAANDYQSNIITKAYEDGGSPSEDEIKYAKSLQDKAQFYQGIVDAGKQKDANGKSGNYIGGGFAVVPIQTPDKRIKSIDFLSNDEIKKAGLMMLGGGIQTMDGGSTMPLAAIPNVTTTPDANGNIVKGWEYVLGNLTYRASQKKDANSDPTTSFTDILEPVGGSGDNIDPAVKAVVDNGMVLRSSYGVNLSDPAVLIPNTVSTRNNNVFYTDAQGVPHYEAGVNFQERVDNMKKDLTARGLDVNTLMPNGKIPIAPHSIFGAADPNSWNGQGVAVPTAIPPPQSGLYDTVGSIASAVNSAVGFFSKKVSISSTPPSTSVTPAVTTQPSIPSKPNVPTESTGGKSWVPDILAKGASFFNSQKTN